MNLKLPRFLVVLLAPAMSLTPLVAVLPQQAAQTGTETVARDDGTVRPFRVNVPEETLVDLRRRLAATRWPDRRTVDGFSQGVQLAKIQEPVRYWRTDYDWRNAEAKLNTLPLFITNIDGLDIHLIHIRSRHPNALT